MSFAFGGRADSKNRILRTISCAFCSFSREIYEGACRRFTVVRGSIASLLPVCITTRRRKALALQQLRQPCCFIWCSSFDFGLDVGRSPPNRECAFLSIAVAVRLVALVITLRSS